MGSIYDQIGGMAAMGATVDELHARVLGDPRLAPSFAAIDTDRRLHHLRAFVATALGGTHGSSSRPPRETADGRAGLGIADRDLDRVAGHLAGALRTIGVPTAQVQAILARIQPLRDEVAAGRPAPAR